MVGEKRHYRQQQNEVFPYPLENSPAAGLRSWLTSRGICMRERFNPGFRTERPHFLCFEGLEGEYYQDVMALGSGAMTSKLATVELSVSFFLSR